MTNSLKRALETMLARAREEVAKVFESDEFAKSNMPLEGWLMLKLTNTAIFEKEEKLMTDEGKKMMAEGARQIAITVTEEFYAEHDVNHEYQIRLLQALHERPLYPHEAVEAIGLHSYGLNTANSVIACLEAKGKIYRDGDFKYRLREEDE